MIRFMMALAAGKGHKPIGQNVPRYNPPITQSMSQIEYDIERTHMITDPNARMRRLVGLCASAQSQGRMDEVLRGLDMLSHYTGDDAHGGIPCDPLPTFSRQKMHAYFQRRAEGREEGETESPVMHIRYEPYDLYMALCRSSAHYPDAFLSAVAQLMEDQVNKYPRFYNPHSNQPSHEDRKNWAERTFAQRFANLGSPSVVSGPQSWFRDVG